MQNEIGQIIIYPPTRAKSPTIGQQCTTNDEMGSKVLNKVYERLWRAIDEYLAETRSAQMNGADNIPLQDIVTVAIKELDGMKGLYQDSFRYDYAEIGGTSRLTVFWDNAEGQHGEPDADNVLDSLVSLIKTQGLGHKPESELEMAAAWLAWHTTPKKQRVKRQHWLEEKFGVDAKDNPNVFDSNFDNYRRKVPTERLIALKDI